MIRQMWQAFCQRQHAQNLQFFSTSELEAPAVIIAPHQDDEVLGCGGTIIRKRQAGAAVDIVFLTDGRHSHSHLMPPDHLAQIRQQEALAAAALMGVSAAHVHFFGLPDGDLSQHIPQATAQLSALLGQIAPAQLFFPGAWEAPPDHQAAHKIARQAVRPSQTMDLYEYPIWFWYHWPMVRWPRRRRQLRDVWQNSWTARLGYRQKAWSTAVPIADVLPQKRAALAAHQTQMSPYGDDPRWLTLAHMAQGDFLNAFFQAYEYFKKG